MAVPITQNPRLELSMKTRLGTPVDLWQYNILDKSSGVALAPPHEARMQEALRASMTSEIYSICTFMCVRLIPSMKRYLEPGSIT